MVGLLSQQLFLLTVLEKTGMISYSLLIYLDTPIGTILKIRKHDMCTNVYSFEYLLEYFIADRLPSKATIKHYKFVILDAQVFKFEKI